MADKKMILVVDDHATNRMMLRNILAERYQIIEAENREIAKRVVASMPIAAVLLDLLMPTMDGYAFLQAFRQKPEFADIPVIVITQSDDMQVEQKALALGATDFIMKPYDPSIIKMRLSNLLQLREMAALRNAAERDTLTGVYHKEAFAKKAEEMLSQTQETYEMVCADIERFKVINELFGSEEGDKLLRFLGKKLLVLAKKNRGICGRLGADVFALLLPLGEVDWQEESFAVQQMISDYAEQMKAEIKFGVFPIDEMGLTVDAMCDRANLAIRLIKGQFGKRFNFYNDEHRRAMLEEQAITSEMYDALVEGQFVVYYQPKYDLTTEHIIGAEALVRWQHPKKGLVLPNKFIPLFERNGFITMLDMYIWKQVVLFQKARLEAKLPVVPISVNISRVDIYNPKLFDFWENLLKETHLPPKLISLEITETAYTENAAQLIETVLRLKTLGFSVEMDDFGSGYSSLNMLNEVPVDLLKLDMKFLQSRETGEKGRNILNFVVTLAKWMGVPVVAEGVETKAQAAFLRGMGCNRGQGYLFSKPLSVAAFEQLLQEAPLQKEKTQKEPEYSVIEIAQIWDPSSAFNLLFNGYIGALAVMELQGEGLSLIRANDRFYEVMGATSEQFSKVAADLMYLVSVDDKQKVLGMFSKAAQLRREVMGDSQWFDPIYGEPRKFHIQVKLIYEQDMSRIFLVSMEDITQKINVQELLWQQELESKQQLQKQHDFYAHLYDTVPCGLAQFSLEEGMPFISANRHTIELFGFTEENFGESTRYFVQFFQEEYPGHLEEILAQLQGLEQGEPLVLEYKIHTVTGELRIVKDITELVKNQEGQLVCQSVFTDITAQRQQEETLRLREEQYLIAAKNANTCIFRFDPQSKCAYMPYQTEDGQEGEKMIENVPESIIALGRVAPTSVVEYRRFFDRIIAGEQTGEARIQTCFKNGGFGWYEAVFYNQRSDISGRKQAVCVFSDITLQKAQEDSLYALSRQDSLTNLLNRKAFEELATQALLRNGEGAFLMVDVDDFKHVNDSYGHMVGDEVLVRIAQVLRQVFRREDLVARMGGDEMAAFMSGPVTQKMAQEKGQTICRLFAESELSMRLTCSVGVSVSEGKGQIFSDLYHGADMALYEAKNSGKNKCVLYREGL